MYIYVCVYIYIYTYVYIYIYWSGQFDAGPLDLTVFWMWLRFGHVCRPEQCDFRLTAT